MQYHVLQYHQLLATINYWFIIYCTSPDSTVSVGLKVICDILSISQVGVTITMWILTWSCRHCLYHGVSYAKNVHLSQAWNGASKWMLVFIKRAGWPAIELLHAHFPGCLLAHCSLYRVDCVTLSATCCTTTLNSLIPQSLIMHCVWVVMSTLHEVVLHFWNIDFCYHVFCDASDLATPLTSSTFIFC